MDKSTELPHELIHHIKDPLARFLKVQAAAGVILLISTIIALFFANSVWAEAFAKIWEMPVGFQLGPLNFTRSLHHWINDGLMTLFFFVVALELKRELVLGELKNLRIAALPLAGAIGGMIFPVVLFLLLMRGQAESHGWGTVMATDTAFLIGCLSLLGDRVPSNLRLFLLSLAIFDDIGAILVVAFGYGDPINWMALALALVGLIFVGLVAQVGTRSIPVYCVLGFLIWLCVEFSGLHPTVTGVVLGLMTPTGGWVSDERLRSLFGKVLSYPPGPHWSGDTEDRYDLRQAGDAARETLSPVERLEMRLHPWVGFVVMPVFALANAGVLFSIDAFKEPVSIAIILSLVLGKPLGVFLLSWISVRLNVAKMLPDLTWPILGAGSLLTGIGFTMSLFIAEISFSAASLTPAKIGVLGASVIATSLGLVALLFLSKQPKPGQVL